MVDIHNMNKDDGVYDNECVTVHLKLDAVGTLLIVFGGKLGNGFSCTTSDPAFLGRVPSILRGVADDMELTLKKAQDA